MKADEAKRSDADVRALVIEDLTARRDALIRWLEYAESANHVIASCAKQTTLGRDMLPAYIETKRVKWYIDFLEPILADTEGRGACYIGNQAAFQK